MRGNSHRRLRPLVAVVGAAGTLAAAGVITAVPAQAASLTAGADTFSVDATSHVASGNVLANDVDPDGQPATPETVTLMAVGKPEKGEVSFTADGAVTYKPQACAPGDFAVQYTIASVADATATAVGQITFTVDGPNTPLKAAPDTAHADAGKATGSLIANDCGATTPVKADDVTIKVVADPKHGDVTVDAAEGTFAYTVKEGENPTTDAFDYTITNATGLEARATVTITFAKVDLAVTMAPPADIDLGVPDTAEVTVTNTGDAAPTDPTVLTFTVPKEVLIDSAPDFCTPNEDETVATCPLDISTLAPGKSVTLPFDVEVDVDTPVGTVVHAITATVSTPGDADPSNDTASTGDLGTVVEGDLAPPPPGSDEPTGIDPVAKPVGHLADTGIEHLGETVTLGVAFVLVGTACMVFARRRRIDAEEQPAA